MEKHLGYDKSYLEEKKAYYTAKEIEQQPRLWRETMEIIKTQQSSITEFFRNINLENSKVIFTGAGTSEFVGNTLVPYLREVNNLDMESRATTDIVNNPNAYIPENKDVVLVSFARSGNSPESVAAVEVANKVSDKISHVIITCNKNGKLANMNLERTLVLYMPEDSNDLGFAMTGSFSCMMLAAYSLFSMSNIEKVQEEIMALSGQMEENFLTMRTELEDIVKLDTERVVFLGGSSFKGLAQELSLKLLELCAGKIPAIFDTPLGFRHGPKSIVNDKTIVFNLLSNNDYSKKYDLDLVKELKNDKKSKVVTFQYEESKFDEDYSINTKYASESAIITALSYLIPGQMYAFMKSLEQGITPDNPCPTGEVNRVVQGVIIHEYVK